MDNFDLKKFLVENKLTENSRLNEDYDTSYDFENIKNTDIVKIGGYLANYLRFPLKNIRVSDDIIMLGGDRYQVIPKPNNDFDIIDVKSKKNIGSKQDIVPMNLD